ncbi:MAG TPA: UDP-N-acetylmuramoyl-L-alanine--D-glutamate ligase [Candidatus Babeliales bacterium]|jgi:UDP-N-acetylmuramoylalanine--D-glutamate ligase|nr:UDP-N-acetylmuramoyl-L-alanine--D-glutamate ligase [Candidatus Babeliales bacterium]
MKLLPKNARIGIWGFGIVGKAAVNYLHEQDYQLGVMDKRVPTEKEWNYLKTKNITWHDESEQKTFFSSYDFIISSPGIYISPLCYATHLNKWIHELDLFYALFHKPIIAITGSIGKTSTTHILAQLFKELSMSVAVGGNIGIPTFDLINQQNSVDYALLEVSSFQLNYCKSFAPTLAIWTNFHPNHLDHHNTEKEYFLAKEKIVTQQTKNQLSLVHFALRNTMLSPIDGHKRSYFIATVPDDNALNRLNNNEQIYYIQDNMVIRYTDNLHTPIITLTPELRSLSFIENILIVAATCDLMQLNTTALQTVAHTVQLPEHRVEKVGTINNVDFYNDSKATTTASTLAAVEKLHNRPLHLFLGGLSKGVDRAPFIAQLKNQVRHVYCFGKEATNLYAMCMSNHIPASCFATLDETVAACTDAIKPGDCVLLSPAGSSYDLYENYEQRGKHFKELVMQYMAHTNE